jgi:hypothetical protein
MEQNFIAKRTYETLNNISELPDYTMSVLTCGELNTKESKSECTDTLIQRVLNAEDTLINYDNIICEYVQMQISENCEELRYLTMMKFCQIKEMKERFFEMNNKVIALKQYRRDLVTRYEKNKKIIAFNLSKKKS